MALDIWINSNLEIFRNESNWLGYSTITSVWWYEDGRGRFKLQGQLPISKELDYLQSGDTVEILHKPHGMRDRYDSSEIVAKLSNCQIKRKWMLNIQPLSSDCQEIAMLYISLTCNVELFR